MGAIDEAITYASQFTKMATQPKVFGRDIVSSEDKNKLAGAALAAVVAVNTLIFYFSGSKLNAMEGALWGCSFFFLSALITYLFARQANVELVSSLTMHVLILGLLLLVDVPIMLFANGIAFGSAQFYIMQALTLLYAIYVLLYIAPLVLSGMTDWGFIKSLFIYILSLAVGFGVSLKAHMYFMYSRYDF
jgi:hypothetical protein